MLRGAVLCEGKQGSRSADHVSGGGELGGVGGKLRHAIGIGGWSGRGGRRVGVRRVGWSSG